MASKRKFKRDYIILEAKDTEFRYKERILPKAFAKVEINEEKSIISLYVENLKCIKDGYRVVAIQSDYETLDLGKVVLSEQGKGEFVLNVERNDIEIKGIALLYEKSIPLIGFKGNKIANYEEILFTDNHEYEEMEYIEMDEDDDYEYEYEEDDENEFDENEEMEYIEMDEDDDYEYEYEEDDENEYEDEGADEFDGYEEVEYIEIEEDDDNYQDEEDGYIQIPEREEKEEENENNEDEYEEYDNVEETLERNLYKPKQQQNKPRNQSMPYQLRKKSHARNQNSKTTGTLLMPRQIKKGLRHFNETKPFINNDIEDTRWWKIGISPTTLCGYTMPYLGYVNSLNYTMYSDAVMHSYKYRHYLFGVQYDEYNNRKCYIYAVPGNKDEQPDQGHTGFSTYKPCDTRNDSLGYWLCFIDSRTRRILK